MRWRRMLEPSMLAKLSDNDKSIFFNKSYCQSLFFGACQSRRSDFEREASITELTMHADTVSAPLLEDDSEDQRSRGMLDARR